MVDPILKAKLDRIGACALDAGRDELVRNLLHAYAACLSPQELCDAAVSALYASAEVRGAIRNRLLWMGREGQALMEIDTLGLRLMMLAPVAAQVRVRIEALLSHIYPLLRAPTRQAPLDRWRDRGTRGAAARWLNAIADDKLLFSVDLVLAYWRQSRDWRAAKLLVYRAEPGLVADILPDLIEGCGGWIVSRGVLRANSVSEKSWTAIRANFPATYAYLCAKTGRSLSEQEAFVIVEEAEGGDRGLAIWAIGQLGMISVLDRIWTARPEFQRRTLGRMGITLADDTEERFASGKFETREKL
jgi:hypothetical protein